MIGSLTLETPRNELIYKNEIWKKSLTYEYTNNMFS